MAGSRRWLVVVCGAWAGLTVGCAPTSGRGGPSTAPSPASSPTATLRSLQEQIEVELPTADDEQCRSWSEQLVTLHEEHGGPYVGARLQAAAVLQSCGLGTEAIEALEGRVETMPRWARAEALNTLAVIAHERGDFGEAVAYLFAALEADPVLAEAQDNLIRLMVRRYADTGSRLAYEEASRRTSEWIVREPDDPRPYLRRAGLLAVHGRASPESLTEAQLLLSELLRRDLSAPVQARVHTIGAQIDLHRGDFTAALLRVRYALALDPQHAPAQLIEGICLVHQRNYEQARRVLEEVAATIDPSEEHERLRTLAVAYRALYRYEDAERTYAQMQQRWPDDLVDTYNRSHYDLQRFWDAEAYDFDILRRARDGFSFVVRKTDDDPQRRSMYEVAREKSEWLIQLVADIEELQALEREAIRLEQQERERRLRLEVRAREAFERQSGG